jgi:hypothetical protein
LSKKPAFNSTQKTYGDLLILQIVNDVLTSMIFTVKRGELKKNENKCNLV